MFSWPLLIAPEGIEIIENYKMNRFNKFLLIAPEGIEIANRQNTIFVLFTFNRTRRNWNTIRFLNIFAGLLLLIAPEGIEIKYKHLLREGFKSLLIAPEGIEISVVVFIKFYCRKPFF